MQIHFTKMHGLGNDMMLLDLVRQPAAGALLTPQRIAAWGDRRTGVGFDQLMVIEPDSAHDAAYRIFNGDGSPAGQCGNGVRCVAAALARERGLGVGAVLRLNGPGGLVTARIESHDQVSVTLPAPDFSPASLPFVGAAEGPPYRVAADGNLLALHLVSLGNPHAVLSVPALADAPVADVGRALNRHAAFPEGVNVSFAVVEARDQLALRVYERGVGETRACGSAACASVATLRAAGLLDETVSVLLPGGKLVISWRGADTAIRMTGPATFVYEGTLNA